MAIAKGAQPVLPPTLPAIELATNSSQSVSTQSVSLGKYTVFGAVRDVFAAARNNMGNFLLSLVISLAISLITLFLIILLTGGLVGVSIISVISRGFTTGILTALVGVYLLYIAWYILTNAFTLASTSWALYVGAEGRPSSLATILSRSFARIGWVVLANLLLAIIVIFPYVLVFLAIAGLMLIKVNVLFLLFIIPIVYIGWIYFVFTRFALIPFVALFEPDVPLLKTPVRSRQLLKNGGAWFLVKGFLLLIVVAILLLLLTDAVAPKPGIVSVIFSNLIAALLPIMANGVLVMLYRNKLATVR